MIADWSNKPKNRFQLQLALRPPFRTIRVGTIPGSGVLTLPYEAPRLATSGQGVILWAQAWVTNAGTRCLTNPTGY